eukprot:gene12943-14275_t
MATDADSRFTSKFRKERTEARRERTERRNRAFDQRDGENRETSGPSSSSTRSTIEIRSTVSSRAARSEVGKSELETVTSRVNRLTVNDDKASEAQHEDDHHKQHHDDGEDHEKSQHHHHHVAKKERGVGATTSKKRQQKKNLREKRRSTGVVIMPNMEPDKEEPDAVKENTVQNEMNSTDAQGKGRSRGRDDEFDSIDKETLIQQLQAYQQAIQEWKEEFDKSQKEIDSLRNENYRLREENSALLKVVNQMSSSTSSRK